MKKFLNIFFVILGVIFFLILLALGYLFVVDPFNIKPFIFDDNKSTQIISEEESTNDLPEDSKAEVSPSKSPDSSLSPAQVSALEAIGIDPVTVPETFTVDQIICFEEILGKERVEEIKSGSTPTPIEFYKAKSCI